MSKLIPLTEAHFAHLAPWEKVMMKRMVYRRSFQEHVRDIRAKHGIMRFPKPTKKLLCALKPLGRPEILLKASDECPRELLKDCKKAFGNDKDFPYVAWRLHILAFVRFDMLASLPPRTEKPRVDMIKKKWLQELDSLYRRTEKMRQEGKIKEAEDDLRKYERVIYLSDNVMAITDERTVRLQILPGFSSASELNAATPYIKNYLDHFKPKKHGGNRADMLDVLNDIAAYSDEGHSSSAIAENISRDYRDISIAQSMSWEIANTRVEQLFPYTAGSIRSMLKRAREMGF